MKFAMITFAAAVGSANAQEHAGFTFYTPPPTLVAAPEPTTRMATAFAAPAPTTRMATINNDVPTNINDVQKLRTNIDQELWTDQIHGRISSLNWANKNTNTMIREDARIEEDEHRTLEDPREDARIEEDEHRIQVEEHRIDLRSTVGCDAESECMDEWRTQRWGDATHEKMCGDPEYHLDCRACSFCAREEEDVRPNFDGTNGNMHGIFDSSMFVDGCNPKTCPEWDCRKWCHCYDTNPNVELMFESVQYGETLARICPEDDTACNCDLE